jgi:hypothetical protein
LAFVRRRRSRLPVHFDAYNLSGSGLARRWKLRLRNRVNTVPLQRQTVFSTRRKAPPHRQVDFEEGVARRHEIPFGALQHQPSPDRLVAQNAARPSPYTNLRSFMAERVASPAGGLLTRAVAQDAPEGSRLDSEGAVVLAEYPNDMGPSTSQDSFTCSTSRTGDEQREKKHPA